ncbi:MAG: ATP-binding cassette domain-containing protein [Spirochaetes bacterium]|jgi:peptide/nickel transport system ATP-binding protein/oligopeptide transport system ATP-binding protein|nr:ATP-binding cassette domain-containing protein [Spirochaetota bacterium]
MRTQEPVLTIEELRTVFHTDDGLVRAAEGVSYELYPGETLAVVGESGSGKSVTALSVLRLIAEPPGEIVSGRITFEGVDLTALSERELRRIRGRKISMIFQEPMTSLNPVHMIGRQIMEPMLLHRICNRQEARRRALELLRKVGIPAPEQRMSEYPHQLSGGMRQRVMIAIALACEPDVLIADEPTSALDVTVQLQILRLLKDLQQQMGMAVILITHDLGVVAEVADRVAVMYAGRVVESGPVEELFYNSVHPYVEGLRASIPDPEQEVARLRVIQGQVPDAARLPPGCPFAPRCPYVMDRCVSEDPPTTPVAAGHHVRCWLNDPETVEAAGAVEARRSET